MRKKKLKIIEAYVYAKTLNLISNNTPINNQTLPFAQTLNTANKLSTNLLKCCENKITSLKLNNTSFLLLKMELESVNYSKDPIQNCLKVCKMINEYPTFLSMIG